MSMVNCEYCSKAIDSDLDLDCFTNEGIACKSCRWWDTGTFSEGEVMTYQKCPYCGRQADADGCITHATGCEGLTDAKLIKLQERGYQDRIRELRDLGSELAILLEGVTQDERDRIETSAGILQSEWFRRQDVLLARARDRLFPDGEQQQHKDAS